MFKELLVPCEGSLTPFIQKLESMAATDGDGPRVSCNAAVESALSSSCYDTAAVEHLLNAEDLRHAVCEAIDIGVLEKYARPLPAMLEYDQLLATPGAR
jgi:hypothetical protein